MQESGIKCGIPGGIKFSSQVGKVGSHHLGRDPAILTWDPGWDCQDPAYIPPASNFSLEYHKNKGNDHYLKRLKVVTQIHLVSTLGNVKTTLWSIYIYTE